MEHQLSTYRLRTNFASRRDQILSAWDRWELIDQLLQYIRGILKDRPTLKLNGRLRMLTTFMKHSASATLRDMNMMFTLLNIPMTLHMHPTPTDHPTASRGRKTSKSLIPGASVSSGLFRYVTNVKPSFPPMTFGDVKRAFPIAFKQPTRPQEATTTSDAAGDARTGRLPPSMTLALGHVAQAASFPRPDRTALDALLRGLIDVLPPPHSAEPAAAGLHGATSSDKDDDTTAPGSDASLTDSTF